jgi:hypothetical protein
MRRAFFLAVVLSFHLSVVASASCLTLRGRPWVSSAAFLAIARYADERTFVVESTLLDRGGSMQRIVVPASEWRERVECGFVTPKVGALYVVRLCRGCAVDFLTYDDARPELDYVAVRHEVTATDVIEEMRRYVRGGSTSAETQRWLQTAEARSEERRTVTKLLIDDLDAIVTELHQAEKECDPRRVENVRLHELTLLLDALEARIPSADTEREYAAVKGKDDPEWGDLFLQLNGRFAALSRSVDYGALVLCTQRAGGLN